MLKAPFGLAWGGLGLTASLARPLAWWLCKGSDSASLCLAHFGGGKIRQTLCVLFLAKIINKKVLFILPLTFVRDFTAAVKKILNVFDFCSVESAPACSIPRKKSIRQGKPNLSWKQRWLAIPHPPSSHSRAASALRASAAPFMCLLPLKCNFLDRYALLLYNAHMCIIGVSYET